VESPSFSRQVGVQVVHEPGELLSTLDGQKKVVVIGEKDEGMDFNWVESLGPSQNTYDKRSQFVAGPEEKPTLDGSACDLHQGTSFRNEP
jgi:hypothetical protein